MNEMNSEYGANKKGTMRIIRDWAMGLAGIGGLVFFGSNISSVIPDTFSDVSDRLKGLVYVDSENPGLGYYQTTGGETICPYEEGLNPQLTIRDVGCDYFLTKDGRLVSLNSEKENFHPLRRVNVEN